MGASNVLAAFHLYAGNRKITPTSLNLLTYMAAVTLDKDAEPSWWEGHEMLAVRVLGYPEPVGRAGKGAVERAIRPLLDEGAITTTRHASGHAGHVTTVRYRLWLGPAHPGKCASSRNDSGRATGPRSPRQPTETVRSKTGSYPRFP